MTVVETWTSKDAEVLDTKVNRAIQKMKAEGCSLIDIKFSAAQSQVYETNRHELFAAMLVWRRP